MQLTVLGATGGTGRLVVEQALDAGHHVRAVVRDPAKLTVRHDRLAVLRADVFAAVDLVPVIDGTDAVVSALGARDRKDTGQVCSRAVRALLEAMERTGVRRVVAVSAQPVLRSGAGEPFWFRTTVTPIVRAVYRNVYADLEVMERLLAGSDTDWTVLRPPYLTDKPGTGRYRTALEENVSGSSLTRADLAKALLDVVGDPGTVRHAIGVAGP
ncbi:NAD(P)-dependent oxidoreductase [Streptomyces sp. enrichment culture]|uniref:NAD(P)-dependent oxidoreductase n=1 Tax=Streptomyces sp. enrichment culture TaxID=1795815 RepID=UPI003F56CAB0